MREVEILKKKQLKCYLYTRVSTSMQVDGYSLDAQRDKLRKYAAYEDMVIAGEYSDEGFSGKNIQGRQDFQRMLNDIQDGKDDVSYVLVFKLSRFGRNAADVLNSLQLMQDFGVNLICVEDGIDSSKDAGKLMISVLSAVAEIERENIRTQTMAGREQKAREGKWNGGFAPYGYKLENGNLVIAEDEVEVIRVIYDRYIHTNEGVAGVAKYLNRNGYTKKLRQNNTIPGFSRDFVKNVLYNPVYMGKIAYGRRRTEKKQGTRNEMHVVEQSEFPVYEGQHEAIISEEDWHLAQEKRKINSFKREKVNNPDHAHILSGILKCPCCGKSMYGNIAKAHSKDKKTRYYYYCKNTVTPTGHECSFRLNIEQTEINKFVAKIISAMVNNPRFVEAIQAKIGTAVDTEDMEKQIAVLQGQLKQAFGTKSRLERQMDTLDINDVHYDRKILDLQRRYDEQYDTIEEIEVQIGELQSQIRNIQQEKISGDNIYRLLLAFDEVYHSATEAEQKEFMKAFTIIGNMDTSIFLGGKEPTTLKELAAVLGKETIDTYNTGESRGRETSHSLNYQKLGKELMSQDELAVMDGGKCILQLRGVRPFLSDKYDITKHPNFKYTADADDKNAFDIEAFLSARLKLKPNEVCDVYEVDTKGA